MKRTSFEGVDGMGRLSLHKLKKKGNNVLHRYMEPSKLTKIATNPPYTSSMSLNIYPVSNDGAA